MIALSPALIAVNEDAGAVGFAPLNLIYSARANALGQAMMAVVKNPDGMQFNPASIIRMDKSQVNSTFMSYYAGSQGGSIQYIKAQNIYAAYGMTLKYLNFGSMDRTEISQQGDLIETGETFGAQNIIAGFSMARFVSPVIDLGGTVKVVFDQIDGENAGAILLDGGLIHHPVNEKIKVGVGFRNLGKQVLYYTSNKYNESIPFTVALGLSYQMSDKLMGSFDISKSTGENFVAKMGIEDKLSPSFTLRGGFKSNAADGYVGGAWAWTSGLSFGAEWNWKSTQIGYGVSSAGDLGLVNQLTLSYLF
ncbi:MAG TPA: PorV/PorQ family protein [Candidatus Cloacimonadota bacterium]|nr:PorV/PorQ family protein [Candidatus Cloacimonadota bacterium]HPS37878.1 PorV/PorQ family protein [Candidatus Cloacimonadota bacterium]